MIFSYQEYSQEEVLLDTEKVHTLALALPSSPESRVENNAAI